MENITYRTGTEVKQVSAGPYKLNMRDIARGLLMAVLGAAIAVAYEALSTEQFYSMATLIAIGKGAMSGGIGYLVKNFFEGAKVVVPNN